MIIVEKIYTKKVTSCVDCPNMYSFGNLIDYTCLAIHRELGQNDGIGILSRDNNIKQNKIPSWCPLSTNKYVVILTNNSWGNQESTVYITKAENPKEAIIKIINFTNERFDQIDIDSAISKYKCEETTGTIGGIYLQKIDCDGDGIFIKAFKIYDNEPTIRLLE